MDSLYYKVILTVTVGRIDNYYITKYHRFFLKKQKLIYFPMIMKLVDTIIYKLLPVHLIKRITLF